MKRGLYFSFLCARPKGEKQPDMPLAWRESSVIRNPIAVKTLCVTKRQRSSLRKA